MPHQPVANRGRFAAKSFPARIRRPFQVVPSAREQPDDTEGIDLMLCHPECLHEIFASQASATPDNIAVEDGERRLTYAEADRLSNRLARYLRAQDIGQGDFVALLLDRSAEVYIGLLAILKAGAAYVPLDPEYPTARIIGVLEDCEASALLTCSAALDRHGKVPGRVIAIDQIDEALSLTAETPLRVSDRDAGWRDPCYVIYTSGSTGRPKGVVIEHRSACNYVRSSLRVYKTHERDRVYQGFSIAFDFAVEEIWMAFGVGAALVVGTLEALRSGPALSGILTDLRITALSCVPTLLSTMEEDIPCLRLLNVGGEACPQDLVKRWWTPSRRVLNTYGPTEATVTATCSELLPDRPITIGVPLPNYGAWILDEDMREAQRGEEGQLYLSGPGLARGYLNRPDLTAERFVPNPFPAGAAHAQLYKTGDLASWSSDGEILFHGRIDGQVKFRGFRIELSEIENVLLEQEGIAGAVVALRERAPGVQALAGYIVPAIGTQLDLTDIKARLRARLPHYMVPTTLDEITSIPVLTSGKTDRKSLPEPGAYRAARHKEEMTPTEAALIACWERVFKHDGISLDADFFLDLGGHSLMAALAVSDLRKNPTFAGIAVSDIYAEPTIRGLAARLDARLGRAGIHTSAHAAAAQPVSTQQFVLCGAAQALLLVLLYGYVAAEITLPIRLAQLAWSAPGLRTLYATVAILLVLAMLPANLLINVAAKWLIIGRFRAGSHPLWGGYYLRWWFVRRLHGLTPVRYFGGTPLMRLYLRALGARIGRDAYIGTPHLQSFDLIEIGDNASVGCDVHASGHCVEGGLLHIGQIRVGAGGYVGANSVLAPNTEVGARASLGQKSMLPRGGRIPDGEHWEGSPARPTGLSRPVAAPPQVSHGRATALSLLLAALVFALPLVIIAAIMPGLVVTLAAWQAWGIAGAALAAGPSALLFVTTLCLIIAGLKRLVIGTSEPGRVPIRSAAYVKRWLLDSLMQLSIDFTNSLYATLYLAPWLRLLGARIGRHSEVSTASHITPDLLTFGEGVFIADAACLGAAIARGGWLTTEETRIGSRSFVGNSALVPAGASVPDDCLIGCLSTPPATGKPFPAGTSWLGLPAIFLPRRQESQQFPEELTFRPTRALILKRGAFEILRVAGPSTVSALVVLALALSTSHLYGHGFATFLWLGLAMMASALAAGVVVVAEKWVLMGAYRPGARPLWSGFCWRTELTTALYENLYVPLIMNQLLGTPFAALGLRALGTRVGKRVYFDSTYVTEFDLVQIGDRAALNTHCSVQTHLFEDRVMKMDRLRIGDDCSVGDLSVVLYSSEMGNGSELGPLSLLMKGESLPPATCWQGSPAQEAYAGEPLAAVNVRI